MNTCRYTVHQSLAEARDLPIVFRQALKNALLRLPFLQVGIRDEDTKSPKFTQVSTLRLSNHYQWQTLLAEAKGDYESSLVRILEAQHDLPFPNTREQPSWRAICVERPRESESSAKLSTRDVYVIFAVHHSLMDGTSASVFHETMLEALNSLTHSEEIPDVVALESKPDIPPCVEDVVPFRISWSYFLGILWKEFAPSWLRGRQPPPPWTGSPATMSPRDLYIRMIQIPSSQLGQVLAMCRKRGTTLTPLIHAMVVASAARAIPREQREGRGFSASTPINLRPFMIMPGMGKSAVSKLMGTYVTSQDHNFDGDTVAAFDASAGNLEKTEEEIWSVAKAVKAELQRRLDIEPNDDITAMLSYVSDFHAWWLKKVGGVRNSTWEISNVGSLSGLGGGGDWKITQSIFTQSANFTGPAFSVNVSGIRETGITITLCWQKDVVKTEIIEQIGEGLRTWFEIIGKS